MVDDAELDRLMRDSLERHADEMDVAAPVARNAIAAVRRRHRGRLTAGFAAASVAAIVVVAAVTSTPPSPNDSDRSQLAPDPADPSSGEWRTEYWKDVQVDVPADWAWGVTPRISGEHLSFCGGVDDGPYVGRPIMQSDVCIARDPTPVPTDPYVWLDAKLPSGTVDLGEGWVQRTVEVGSSTVTVGTDDPRLAERIAESVQEAGLCAPRLAKRPVPRRDWTFEGVGPMREARVCAYRLFKDEFHLAYAAPLTEDALLNTYNAVDEAPAGPVCKATNEFVVVSAVFEDPYSPERLLWLNHDLVFDMDCGHVAVEAQVTRTKHYTAITEESVAPWATGGTRYIVCWGGRDWAHKYFLQGWC